MADAAAIAGRSSGTVEDGVDVVHTGAGTDLVPAGMRSVRPDTGSVPSGTSDTDLATEETDPAAADRHTTSRPDRSVDTAAVRTDRAAGPDPGTTVWPAVRRGVRAAEPRPVPYRRRYFARRLSDDRTKAETKDPAERRIALPDGRTPTEECTVEIPVDRPKSVQTDRRPASKSCSG